MRSLFVAGAALTLSGCAVLDDWMEDLSEAPIPQVAGLVTVPERYSTVRDEQDNVDSVAVWHGPDGQHWLIATAKETDRLLIHDATDGALLRKYGRSGTAPGQFKRPNGVFVIDDLLWIVERDNRRVQLLRLPGLEPLATFGDDGDEALRKPYGLWVHKLASGDLRVFVTDNLETADAKLPPETGLGHRVHQFLVRQTAGGDYRATRERRFGATRGRGVLHVVESIWGDPAQGLLMIADEDQYTQRNVKVYGMDGRFADRTLGGGVFHFQPEGLALYDCADGSGWWLATDQGKDANYFHVFDRRSLEYRGSFSGQRTLNTDGVWMTRQALPGFAGGAFYAVHDDGNVAAFDLDQILQAMNLARCAAP